MPTHGDAAEILERAQRATSLTRQLLAFSRRQVIAPADFDLSKAVSDLAGMLRKLIGPRIRLSIRNAPEPAWVQVLFVTGVTDERTLRAVETSTHTRLLHKPFTTEALIRGVDELIAVARGSAGRG